MVGQKAVFVVLIARTLAILCAHNTFGACPLAECVSPQHLRSLCLCLSVSVLPPVLVTDAHDLILE